MNKRQIKKKSFSEIVYEKVKIVPKGRVTTYQELAAAAGNKKAGRAVGNILHANKKLVTVPCHRVVRSDGRLGGYAGGQRRKISLLNKEGIKITNDRIINFYEKKHLF